LSSVKIDHNPLCDAACAGLVLAAHSRAQGMEVLDVGRLVVVGVVDGTDFIVSIVFTVSSTTSTSTTPYSCQAGPDTALALATAPDIKRIGLDDAQLGCCCVVIIMYF
jgi:hypothetical protein